MATPAPGSGAPAQGVPRPARRVAVGGEGVSGLTAPAYALVRAALRTARQRAARGTGDALEQGSSPIACPPVPIRPSSTSAARLVATTPPTRCGTGPADPFVGPLGEGAGKIKLHARSAALRGEDIVLQHSLRVGPGRRTGPRDLQGSWQVRAIGAGWSRTQTFVAHAAPGVCTSGALPVRARPSVRTERQPCPRPGSSCRAVGGDPRGQEEQPVRVQGLGPSTR